MTTSLRGARNGKRFAAVLKTSGGSTLVSLKLVGPLPPGLTFDASTGVLSGVPTLPARKPLVKTKRVKTKKRREARQEARRARSARPQLHALLRRDRLARPARLAEAAPHRAPLSAASTSRSPARLRSVLSPVDCLDDRRSVETSRSGRATSGVATTISPSLPGRASSVLRPRPKRGISLPMRSTSTRPLPGCVRGDGPGKAERGRRLDDDESAAAESLVAEIAGCVGG